MADTTKQDNDAAVVVAATSLAKGSFGRSSSRVRKATAAFVPTMFTSKKNQGLEVAPGNGTKLEDMPNVVSNFQQVTWSNPHLKMLHMIVFGVGKKKEFKQRLLGFSGYANMDSSQTEKIRAKIHKLQLQDLKSVMDLVDIERGQESFDEKKNPTKDMLTDRFLQWIEEPFVSGRSKRKLRTLKGATTKKGTTTTAATSTSAKRKKSTAAAASSNKKKKKTAAPPPEDDIDFNIPGASIAQIRQKVHEIVAAADRETCTVKAVRKQLEDWLDVDDLKDHKDAIRCLVMEALKTA